MSERKIVAIIFSIVLLGILVANITIMVISKSKGEIIIKSSNIVEQFEKNRTIGQYFKIEKNSYEVYKKFYIGDSSNSVSGPLATYYKDVFFIIHILEENDKGYYMAAMIRTKKNSENSILNSLEKGETVDLIGMVSKMDENYTYGDTKVINKFYSTFEGEREHVLEYCINVI